MTDVDPQVAPPPPGTYPKAMYRAIVLDGALIIGYTDHGEAKIHPQCYAEVTDAAQERALMNDAWRDSPAAAFEIAHHGDVVPPIVTT